VPVYESTRRSIGKGSSIPRQPISKAAKDDGGDEQGIRFVNVHEIASHCCRDLHKGRFIRYGVNSFNTELAQKDLHWSPILTLRSSDSESFIIPQLRRGTLPASVIDTRRSGQVLLETRRKTSPDISRRA